MKPRVTRYDKEVEAARQAIFARALEEAGGNITQAARLLGMDRQLFYQHGVKSQNGRGGQRKQP